MNKRLYRNRQEGALSGVCAGLAEYLNVDKTWIRLAFVVSVIFSSMLGLGMLGPIVYIVLWVALPVKPQTLADTAQPFAGGGMGGGMYDQHYDVDYRVGSGNAAYGTDPGNIADQAYRSYPDSAYGAASKPRERGQNNQDRYIAGLILLIIGIFFLLHQLNILFVHNIIRYWPVLLILSGIVVLFGAFKGNRESGATWTENSKPEENE